MYSPLWLQNLIKARCLGREIVSGSYDRTIRIFPYNVGRSRDIYHTKRMQKITQVLYSNDDKVKEIFIQFIAGMKEKILLKNKGGECVVLSENNFGKPYIHKKRIISIINGSPI